MSTKTDSEIIDELGGPAKVALECDISSQAVTQWRKKGIPKPWFRFFALKYPDIFGADEERRRV
jgi:hypothetical protein